MNDLSELTVIIPSYNRHAFVLRSMNFWKKTNAKVHVLDGSEFSIDQNDLVGLPKNIRYHHYPTGVVERLKIACDLIETEFVILQSDDEFCSRSALEECISELNNDPELISCCCRAIGFSYDSSLRTVIGSEAYPALKDYKVDQQSPLERVVFHMLNYVPSCIYSVVRSQEWKNSMKVFLSKELNLFAIGELQFELAISYFGKSKVIPRLFWFRSGENQGIRGTDPSLDINKRVDVWWKDKSQIAKHNEFLDNMVEHLSLGEDDDKSYIRRCVEEGMDAYMLFLERHRGQDMTSPILVICSKIYRKILGWAYAFKSLQTPATCGLKELSDTMIAEGVFVDTKEVQEIEDIIKDFHEKTY